MRKGLAHVRAHGVKTSQEKRSSLYTRDYLCRQTPHNHQPSTTPSRFFPNSLSDKVDIMLNRSKSFHDLLLLALFVTGATAHANIMPCNIKFDPSEVVMEEAIVSADKAKIVFHLQVRPQGTEDWITTMNGPITVSPGVLYEARFNLSSVQDDPTFKEFQFLLETAPGGSFAEDRTGHCQNNVRAGGRGDRIVTFTVDGTIDVVDLVGIWGVNFGPVTLTPVTKLLVQAASEEL
eukprot:scaffold618_cov175-Amphora_coffeaeformis.AAC.5